MKQKASILLLLFLFKKKAQKGRPASVLSNSQKLTPEDQYYHFLFQL